MFDFTDTELARKKQAKKDNSETEADSSSSDHSCFVALVTASNLQKDYLVIIYFKLFVHAVV